MERRSFLGVLTAASVVLKTEFARAQAVPSVSAQASKPGEFPQDSTIILVHGAWADGSCWKTSFCLCERHGPHVICALIPLTSLTDDAAALKRALERTQGPVVLVGHAYSGAVIAAAPEDRESSRSIYIMAALAPDEGETVAKRLLSRQAESGAAHAGLPMSHGFIWMPADGFRRAVAHKASSDQTKIATAVQRPIAVQCIQEPASKPTWKTKLLGS